VVVPLLLLRVWHYGFEALAITTAVAVGIECLCLAECLRRKLDGLEGRYLRDCFLKIALASAFMTLSLLFARGLFAGVFPQTRLGYLSELAVSIPLALGGFLAAARALGIEEIGFAYYSFVVPTWRRLRSLHAKIPIG
jgi:peptidoglycan biosynthesis protein MviN/MurJ (putative lipid II flippase)